MEDPLGYLLKHYLSQWEIEFAVKIRDSEGLPAAIEYLRSEIVSSCRGSSGPTSPRLDTRSGVISYWPAGDDKWTRPAPYSITAEKFAAITLNNLVQPRLF